MPPAISVENLSKAYRIGLKEEIPDTLVGAVASLFRAPIRNFRRLRRLNTFTTPADNSSLTTDNCALTTDTLWALRDVSFEVHEGEVIGIIGRNGAGKSTLLKILSRITEPTSGRAVIRGRVSSLLEVGTGFHAELTGRENVYMNGTILGMTKREIDRKFDEIVEFSGVERFLDTPIKRYSSGMKVRLAFAVAAHLEPEILIIDEVLAVGDAEFQKKCLGKMEDVARQGRTVLFVSHNMPAVRSLTSRGAYLRDGQLVAIGETGDIIDRYLDASVQARSNGSHASLDYYRRERREQSLVRFNRIWVDCGTPTNEFVPTLASGNDVILCLELHASERISEACLSVSLLKNHEQCVVTLFSLDQDYRLQISPGLQTIRCHIRGLPLSPGRYTINTGINKNANAQAFDVLLDVPVFDITLREATSGELDWAHRPWGAVHWKDIAWQTI